eukprot:scaffold2875_cov120-Isochrysis_galbana.AAC.4
MARTYCRLLSIAGLARGYERTTGGGAERRLAPRRRRAQRTQHTRDARVIASNTLSPLSYTES